MREKLETTATDVLPKLKTIFLTAGDVTFLILGIFCIAIGVFLIYVPAGWIALGTCFTALAFIIGKKQAESEYLKQKR